MTNTTPGREPIQIVEIQQPLCEHDFGVLPCTASGAADRKCYRTRATCSDPDNFELGDPLILRFAKGEVAEIGIPDAGYLIPSLVSVSTAPTRINLAGANVDASGLGNRALCTIAFQDHPHTDRIVDPYLSGRTWDPLSPDRGSFWSRWAVRNKHRQNALVKIYEGYDGQNLADMQSRSYFIDSLQGPDSAGRVVIKGKDILARLEERKSQAPLASPGVLFEDIDELATSFVVAGAVASDYPIPEGYGAVRIGDEIIYFTSRELTQDGLILSGLTRGADGTVAEAHSVDDVVQRCLVYADEPIGSVLINLLGFFGRIPFMFLDLAQWAQEINEYLGFYRLNAVISDPVSVTQLISEIQVSVGCFLWWDERAAKVRLKAVRGVDTEPPTITDNAHIIAGSFSLKEMPRERISQVWFYYSQRTPVGSLEDESNFDNVFIAADLPSETEEQYGDPSIRKIYSRWINTAALAQTTAVKIISLYVDTPSQVTFEMDAKDREYWIGDSFYISHYLDVDAFGERRLRQWTVTSAEEVVPGERVRYVCADTTLYGRIYVIQEDGAADYDPAATYFNEAFIGDDDGLLSDGTLSARIA